MVSRTVVPSSIDVQARYDFNSVPDGLVRYDNEGPHGSYIRGSIAAWAAFRFQVQAFAQALSGWRRQQRQIKARLEREELRRTLRSQLRRAFTSVPRERIPESALDEALTQRELR